MRHVDSGTTAEMIFLGPWDADFDRHIYNYQAPLCQAVMGSAVGDTVELANAGAAGQVRDSHDRERPSLTIRGRSASDGSGRSLCSAGARCHTGRGRSPRLRLGLGSGELRLEAEALAQRGDLTGV